VSSHPVKEDKNTDACGCDSHSHSHGLISAAEALDHLLDAAQPISQTESIELTQALGRVLATACISPINVPPADNSAMDGYALSTADVNKEQNRLPISQRICAGEMGDTLAPGTVARIFTGAPVPDGADAVIMQEQVELEKDLACFTGPIKPGQNVRRAGEDIAIDDQILKPGTRLRGQEMGLAASIGQASLSVYRRLKVGVFFTGDELVEPGNPLTPGKIYDSNRYTLHGLLQAMGCQIIDLGVVEDTLDATRKALKSAAEQTDLVITSGGVSVGEEDHVRIALEELGQLSLWRIAMKPGKPLAFGQFDDTPFIGLPGNPVSVFATFMLFAAPFIKKMQGMTNCIPQPVPVVADLTFPRPGKRQEYLRARLKTDDKGQTSAETFPHQGSGVLTSTSWGDGFVVIPIDTTVQPGDLVDYLPFTNLL